MRLGEACSDGHEDLRGAYTSFCSGFDKGTLEMTYSTFTAARRGNAGFFMAMGRMQAKNRAGETREIDITLLAKDAYCDVYRAVFEAFTTTSTGRPRINISVAPSLTPFASHLALTSHTAHQCQAVR